MKRTELHRHAQLQRRTYLRTINPERKARRREAGEVYAAGYVWMIRQRCAFRGIAGNCAWSHDRNPEAHHVKSVGAGGKDADNIVPCCHLHHDLIHSGRERFEARFNVNLTALAREWWARYLESEEAA